MVLRFLTPKKHDIEKSIFAHCSYAFFVESKRASRFLQRWEKTSLYYSSTVTKDCGYIWCIMYLLKSSLRRCSSASCFCSRCTAYLRTRKQIDIQMLNSWNVSVLACEPSCDSTEYFSSWAHFLSLCPLLIFKFFLLPPPLGLNILLSLLLQLLPHQKRNNIMLHNTMLMQAENKHWKRLGSNCVCVCIGSQTAVVANLLMYAGILCIQLLLTLLLGSHFTLFLSTETSTTYRYVVRQSCRASRIH